VHQVAMLGETELGRYRGLEAMLKRRRSLGAFRAGAGVEDGAAMATVMHDRSASGRIVGVFG